MTNICFVDCETTGLDPQEDAIIEVALIKDDEEVVWWIDLTEGELGRASSIALRINHYYQRSSAVDYSGLSQRWTHHRVKRESRNRAALKIAKFTDGCILAGNTVKFDQQFLEAWLRRHGACPVWDYHVLDVPTFAAGVLTKSFSGSYYQQMDRDNEHYQDVRQAIIPPFKSSRISRALDVPEPEGNDKHTALADARWSKRMWEVVTS